MSEFTDFMRKTNSPQNMWEHKVLSDLFYRSGFRVIRSIKSHPWLCELIAPNGAKFTVRNIGGQWDVASWRHDRPLGMQEPFAYYYGDEAGMVAFVNKEVQNA